ncbi:hypothetical protein T439DRAFT_60426 [Meredithblackwellia eburnea MCA 4105]
MKMAFIEEFNGPAPMKTGACAACQRQRKACSPPIPGGPKFPCKLCIKLGKICLGAGLDGRSFRRKPRSKRDEKTNTRSPPTAQPDNFSSAGWIIMQSQLGLLLQYHLIEIGMRQGIRGFPRKGIQGVSSILSKVGRLSELDPIDEIILSRIQLKGLSRSSHSAIVQNFPVPHFEGFRAPHSSNIYLGLQREALALKMQERLRSTAPAVRLDPVDPARALDHLLFMMEAFNAATVLSRQVELEGLRITLRLGVALIRHPSYIGNPSLTALLRSFLNFQAVSSQINTKCIVNFWLTVVRVSEMRC